MTSLDVLPGAIAIGRAAPELDPDSRRWLECLRGPGLVRIDAIDRLHGVLLGAARREVGRRPSAQHFDASERDDIAHQAASDALMAILTKLGGFRGESRFTTWAYKFVVLEVATKIGSHRWMGGASSLDDATGDRLPDRLGLGPAEQVEGKELLRALAEAVATDLTSHQRRVFLGIVVQGVPLDALAAELGTNRNALYKSLHDARRKLRARLVATGHLDVDERGRP